MPEKKRRAEHYQPNKTERRCGFMCSLPFDIAIIDKTKILLVRPGSGYESMIEKAIGKFFPGIKCLEFQLTGCQKMISMYFDGAIEEIRNNTFRSDWKICALEIKENKIWVDWI